MCVGRTKSGDVNGRRVISGHGEVRCIGRLGVEAARLQSLDLSLIRAGAVAEKPHPRDDHRSAIVPVRMGRDLRMRRNAKRDGVRPRCRWIARQHRGLDSRNTRGAGARAALGYNRDVGWRQPALLFLRASERCGGNGERKDHARGRALHTFSKRHHCRKSLSSLTVSAGFSSISQCPEWGITACCTFVAAKRMTVAIIGPNDFSPPTANTGMISMPLVRNALLSMAS